MTAIPVVLRPGHARADVATPTWPYPGPPLGLLARLPTNGRHLYPEAIGSTNGPVTSSETSVSCPPDRPTGCELDRFPGEVRIMVSSLRLLLLAHYSQDR